MSSTLLYIDDDRRVLDGLEAGLGDDTALIHCRDLEEAYEILVVEEPDLVVLEIRLASGNGLDFVERVRRDGMGAANTPIVVVTSAGRTPGVHGRAMQLGVAEYLTKPISPRQLVACIEEQLARKAEASADPNEDSISQVGIGAGRLSDLPLPELLDRIHRRGEGGVLIVGDARKRTGIEIRNGSPVAVSLAQREDIDEFLIRTERLTRDARDDALSLATLGLSTIEEVLLDAGVVDEATIETALIEQADEAVFQLFELPKGRYRFEPGRRLKGARSLPLTRSAQSLIVRGVLAWAPIETIRSALARYADLYALASADPEPPFDDVPFSDAQRSFVEALVGDRAVGDFLDGSEFEQRTLYGFAILGSIDLTPDPMLVLDEAVAPEAKREARKEAKKEARQDPRPQPTRTSEPARDEPEDEPELLLTEEHDLGYEETLFDGQMPGEPDAEPIRDLAYEDDLFELRAFEEDSFESEMVSESASDAAHDSSGDSDSLIDIDQLVSSDDTPRAPEPELTPEPTPAPEPVPTPESAPELRTSPAEPAGDDLAKAPEKKVRRRKRKKKRPVPKPAVVVEEKVAKTDAPARASEKPAPVIAKPVPAIDKPAPAIDKPTPVSVKPAPVGEKPAPVSEKPAPVSEKPAPVSGKPAPVSEKPAAVAEKPAPVSEEPAPVAEKPTAVAAKPSPVAEQPKEQRAPAEAPAAPEAEAETHEKGASAELAVPEPTAPEPTAPEPTAPEPTAPRTSANRYQIAAFGNVETDPAERALIAARVQKRMGHKYAHLVDRDKPVDAENLPASAADRSRESPATRALDAESWFRKGRDLLKVKKYDQSVEAFGMSAHLDPSEGEYVAHLGYALYLSKPDNDLVRKEALEDIARGIKLSPDRELPYVYLGRIFKVQGELDKARKMFDRALKIRPHCREAAQEVRLMEMRDRKKKPGLLGRFLK